jgi:DNA repair exonuclease SbcCD ATPase subunit
MQAYFSQAQKQASQAVNGLQSQVNEWSAARRLAEESKKQLEEVLRKQQDELFAIQQKLRKTLSQNSALWKKANNVKSANDGTAAMKKQYDQAVLENEAVKKELLVLKKDFEVVQAVKIRIAEVEQALSSISAKKGKDAFVKTQLQLVGSQLDGINAYLMALRENNPLPDLPLFSQSGADNKKQNLDLNTELAFRKEIDQLRSQLDLANKENNVLRDKYKMAQETVTRDKQNVSERDEKIFSLQSKLIEAENNLSDTRSKYADFERSSASLRERYVAGELEKERLRVKLSQTTLDLQDLRKKFVALLNKISGVFKSAEDEPVANNEQANAVQSTGKVSVQLLPQVSAQQGDNKNE